MAQQQPMGVQLQQQKAGGMPVPQQQQPKSYLSQVYWYKSTCFTGTKVQILTPLTVPQ
jgi:hypothetical protein